ncbi:MAG: hypothetical protein ACR2NZ_25185, partial [Rubripirellula sp.]
RVGCLPNGFSIRLLNDGPRWSRKVMLENGRVVFGLGGDLPVSLRFAKWGLDDLVRLSRNRWPQHVGRHAGIDAWRVRFEWSSFVLDDPNG